MSLEELRSEIDEVDGDIVALLSRRAGIVERVRTEKEATHTPAYDPAREARLLRAITARGAEPLPVESLDIIFREIISACRALQYIKVAYLGPPYTNTYLAALSHFGASAQLRACRAVDDIFGVAERKEAHVGIVPIENSIQGVVGETCDCLTETSLLIVGEHYLPIHHALMARCKLGDIRVVYSHPQVLMQTREWLRENLPTADQIATSSSSAAANQAAHTECSAALAPPVAAEPHGLQILAENCEDRPDNRTRFLVVGSNESKQTGRDKTSIVFATQHRAGALHEALGPLYEHAINMTFIQSRPSRGKLWEYVFFVDFEGHSREPEVAGALEQLRGHCAMLKVLGSYPSAE